MTQDVLMPLLRAYVDKAPAESARTLEMMSEEQAAAALGALPAALAGRIGPHLRSHHAAELLRDGSVERIKAVTAPMDATRVAAVLAHLDDASQQRVLPYLSERQRFELREQMTYPSDSVGRIMSGRYLSFSDDMKGRDVTRQLKATARKGLPNSYVYVLDAEQRLVGVLNMYDLMLADADRPIREIMRTEVFTLDGFMSQEEAAAELAKRRYFAAPVVDRERRMLGLVRSAELFGDVQQEVVEDLQKMVGVGGDERVFSPITFSLRKRLPWLHVNLLTAFMAAAVVALFEPLIAKITILAVFLPIVAGQGGNAGAQSLAIVMRGLVMREIPADRRNYLIFKETLLGTVNGVVTGLVTAIVAYLWYGNAMLGVVVAMGMVVNLLFAGMAGASIPLAMKALRLDPAQCSSIILTTVTDVVGFFAFLGFALIFQSYLPVT
jgi:magnesium transporter